MTNPTHTNRMFATDGAATFNEAAAYLSLSERTVRRLIDSGELTKVYVGRSPRITWESLKKILATSETT